jgi:acyl-CoA synthetase (AMP-forming)/AMP-acid ligase II
MLYERWCRIAAEHHSELALRDVAAGRRWTYAELKADAESWPAGDGRILHPQGHGPGFVLAVLAAWRSGKVVCPLEPEQAVPKFLEPPANCIHLKSTSATTGAARSVAFQAEQLAADAWNIVATMGLRPAWPNLGVISMAHSYGFSNLVLPLLLHGIPLVLVPSPLPETIRLAAQGEPAITLAGVPALWRAWHEAGAIPPNVRLAISAGAALPASLEQAVFDSSGLKIHNFYGSTECGGIAYDAGNTPRADDACVGAPMRNVNLSLGENGCLIVQSRAVGETYWPEPADMLGAGRFQTSDLAEIKDGLVYLRGRLSEQINVAGRKVSPSVIEQALIQHPAVRGCVVFGVPDRDGGRAETIVACVVAKRPVMSDDLRTFLGKHIPAWQVPREWRFVDSLSENQRGKISRAEWRRKYSERRSGTAANS